MIPTANNAPGRGAVPTLGLSRKQFDLETQATDCLPGGPTAAHVESGLVDFGMVVSQVRS